MRWLKRLIKESIAEFMRESHEISVITRRLENIYNSHNDLTEEVLALIHQTKSDWEQYEYNVFKANQMILEVKGVVAQARACLQESKATCVQAKDYWEEGQKHQHLLNMHAKIINIEALLKLMKKAKK